MNRSPAKNDFSGTLDFSFLGIAMRYRKARLSRELYGQQMGAHKTSGTSTTAKLEATTSWSWVTEKCVTPLAKPYKVFRA
jgi:hypothetical protein